MVCCFVADIDENHADFHVSVTYRPRESGVHLIILNGLKCLIVVDIGQSMGIVYCLVMLVSQINIFFIVSKFHRLKTIQAINLRSLARFRDRLYLLNCIFHYYLFVIRVNRNTKDGKNKISSDIYLIGVDCFYLLLITQCWLKNHSSIISSQHIQFVN